MSFAFDSKTLHWSTKVCKLHSFSTTTFQFHFDACPSSTWFQLSFLFILDSSFAITSLLSYLHWLSFYRVAHFLVSLLGVIPRVYGFLGLFLFLLLKLVFSFTLIFQLLFNSPTSFSLPCLRFLSCSISSFILLISVSFLSFSSTLCFNSFWYLSSLLFCLEIIPFFSFSDALSFATSFSFV